VGRRTSWCRLESPLWLLLNPNSEVTQPEEGTKSSDVLMTPVPEEAFEAAEEELDKGDSAEMGAVALLEAEAPASTAEASSAEEPAGAWGVCGCAEGEGEGRGRGSWQ